MRLQKIDMDSRAERREIRFLLSELRKDMTKKYEDTSKKLEDTNKKLDLLIYDVHRLSFKVKQLQEFSTREWISDIASAVTKVGSLPHR